MTLRRRSLPLRYSGKTLEDVHANQGVEFALICDANKKMPDYFWMPGANGKYVMSGCTCLRRAEIVSRRALSRLSNLTAADVAQVCCKKQPGLYGESYLQHLEECFPGVSRRASSRGAASLVLRAAHLPSLSLPRISFRARAAPTASCAAAGSSTGRTRSPTSCGAASRASAARTRRC